MVLQAFILITSKEKTTVAIVSLATSALTIAYPATTNTYDVDVSISNRRRSPKMFGMIPDEGRGFAFFLMVMLSTFQVVARAFSTALLAATNPRWLLLWMSSDMLLYFCYKAFRRDLVYYLPLEGILKYANTFFPYSCEGSSRLSWLFSISESLR